MPLFSRARPVIDPAVAAPFVAARVPHHDHLSAAERARLDAMVERLLTRPRWAPSNGFELTDEIIGTVAGLAGLLALGLDEAVYDDIRDIVVHPSTIMLGGQRRIDRWVVADGPQPVLGHTAATGPVHIAWNAVTRDVRDPDRGHNVVLHEFAHRLDMNDGSVDGTPQMDDDTRRRWVQVLQAELDDLRAGVGSALLRPYAATNPGECFAVMTEVFFTRPAELAEDRPEVFAILRRYFRQDPAARLR